MHEAGIGFEIKALSNLIRRAADNLDTVRVGKAMTGMHGWVIGFLYRNRDHAVFQRDVEAECSIRRSTATGILRLMEQNGLIKKSPVDYDQRLKALTLTDKAVAMQEQFMAEISILERRLRSGLSDDEISAFLATLEKMKRNMK